MAKKKSKQEDDYYAEKVNFSDDPEDSFYATGKKKTKVKTHFKKELIWGFQWWEVGVLILECLLLLYALFVLLGLLPLL